MCRFKIIILTNQMVGSEFSINNMKAQIHRALHQQFQINAICNIFLAHIRSLSNTLVQLSMFKRHSLPEYCFWPFPSIYDLSCLLMAACNRIMCHVMKFESPSQMTSVVTRSQSSWLVQVGGINKSAPTVWCNQVSKDQNLWGCFQNLIESMPGRIKVILKAKRGQNRY